MRKSFTRPTRIHLTYMNITATENDNNNNNNNNNNNRRQEQRSENDQNQVLKRQKPPTKSFVWADELKRQLTHTLKPCKHSNTDIPAKHKSQDDQQEGRFFTDANIENIFLTSEYFKMKNGSVSFCSGENGENRWTLDSRNPIKKVSGKPVTDDATKPKKVVLKKTPETDELKTMKENIKSIMQEVKTLNQDFSMVKMDLKTIEQLLRVQKSSSCKSKRCKKENQNDLDSINSKLGKFSEEVEKAAHELRHFIDSNRTLLADGEEILDTPDFDKIISNLHRLSETAYQPKITQTMKGAKFEVPRELPIVLYADGMLFRNNDFRKYTDIRAGLFLRDIEDGFFPSELWPEFPYGVPFQVTDKRSELFSEGNIEYLDRFPGSGQRLGSIFDGKPSSMVYLRPAKYELTDGDARRGSHLQERTKLRCAPQPEDRGDDDIPKLLSIKVRLGEDSHLNVNVMSNERMSHFRDVLFSKLCERYHDDYVGCDTKPDEESMPDFEVHVYGRRPVRLSESLSLLPRDCGIVDNCVVNLTEL